MKIAFGLFAMVLLSALPIHAQSIGGSLAPPTSFPVLPWTPPATPQTLNVSGAEATFSPSTFLAFDRAVAAGKANLKEQAKTVAEAAAESRNAKASAKIQVAQDDNGNVVFWAPRHR
jgi:hypothetical protein